MQGLYKLRSFLFTRVGFGVLDAASSAFPALDLVYADACFLFSNINNRYILNNDVDAFDKNCSNTSLTRLQQLKIRLFTSLVLQLQPPPRPPYASGELAAPTFLNELQRKMNPKNFTVLYQQVLCTTKTEQQLH